MVMTVRGLRAPSPDMGTNMYINLLKGCVGEDGQPLKVGGQEVSESFGKYLIESGRAKKSEKPAPKKKAVKNDSRNSKR